MTKLNEIELGQLCQSTIESLYEATGGMKQFPGLLKKIIETKAWLRRISSGKVVELTSLRELITAKPVRGWGEDIKTVEAVIRNDPECLAMFREAMKGISGRPSVESSHIVTTLKQQPTGNSRAYSIARVQSQCDAKTVAAVMAGKMSANGALVKAGLRDVRQIYLPREPAKAVEKLRKVFGLKFVNAMLVENTRLNKH
jgi:hypothetical protein